MTRRFVRLAGVMLTLALLLGIAVNPVLAGDTTVEQVQTAGAPGADAEQAEDATLICLVLVGGTALLAGGVWMAKIRRMLS